MSKSFIFLFLIIFSAFSFAATPSVLSDSHPNGEWSDNQFITFEFSYSGATQYLYLVDTAENTIPSSSDSSVAFVSSSDASYINIGSKLDGIYWIHVRAKDSSGWSDTTHYEIKLDKTGPLRPENITAEPQENGDIKISWETAEDSLSGTEYYDVYRSVLLFVKDGDMSRQFRIRDAVAKKIASNVTENFIIDSNSITEGYRYHYKAVAFDKAGNQGVVSQAASARAPSFCDFVPNIETEIKDNNLVINVETAGQFKKGHVSITVPSGKEIVLVESESNVSSITTTLGLSNNIEGDYNIFFTSIDNDQDECIAQKTFYYDITNPEIEIVSPESTNVLEYLVKFEFNVSDSGTNPSGIEKVSLFVEKDGEEVLIGDAVEEGSKYVYDWNTLHFNNGRFKVIVRAYDKKGNTSEDFDIYSITNNYFESVTSEEDLKTAESERKKAVEFIASMKQDNIPVESIEGLLVYADSNLSYAKSLSEKERFADSSVSAKKAKTEYAKILQKINVQEYGVKNYKYDISQLDLFLSASRLDSLLVDESKELIAIHQPSRKLLVKKITDGSNSYYRANIEIELIKGDSNSILKIVEVIPKKFTDSALELSSIESFEILREDPVIVFDSIEINSSEKKFVYSLELNLTKEQADALLEANVMNYYVSPPILLKETTDVSSIALASLLDFTGIISSLPEIEWNTNTMIIVGVGFLLVLFILFLIIVLSVLAVYFLFIKKRRGWGA